MINKIFETNEYNFTFIKGNCEIKSNKVRHITESIKKYGLINPININKNHQIIDGQHRYLACKSINHPIKYFISNIEDQNLKLISLINDINSTQKSWSNKDIGYAFSIYSENKESYKKYLELVNMGVSHSTVIEACGLLTRGNEKARSYYNDFKNGTLIITDRVKNRVASQIKMLIDSNIDKKIWNKIYFIRALLKLDNQDDFEAYQFIDNFNKFPQKWIPSYTVDEHLKAILTVHNFNSRKKAGYYIV